MGKTRLIGITLLMFVVTISPAGCKDAKKQKALAEEAAQAKTEVIKSKAEIVQLKSEISYLNEKLVTANQARDNAQIQLDHMIKDSNSAVTNEDNIQQENDKLRKLLAEQLKKDNELEKRIENLKAVIRELQARIEQPPVTEQTPKDKQN